MLNFNVVKCIAHFLYSFIVLLLTFSPSSGSVRECVRICVYGVR